VQNLEFRQSVRRKPQVVYDCATVMLFCRVAVKSKTAALQHRNTKNDALPPANHEFDIRLPAVGRNLDVGIAKWGFRVSR